MGNVMLVGLVTLLLGTAPFRDNSRLILRIDGRTVEISQGVQVNRPEYKNLSLIKIEHGFEIRASGGKCSIRKVNEKQWRSKKFKGDITEASYVGRSKFAIAYREDFLSENDVSMWNPFSAKQADAFDHYNYVPLSSASLSINAMTVDFRTRQWAYGAGYVHPWNDSYRAAMIGSVSIGVGADQEIMAVAEVEASPTGGAVAVAARRVSGTGSDVGKLVRYSEAPAGSDEPLKLKISDLWGDDFKWSPDGKYLACGSHYSDWGVWILDVKTMDILAKFDKANLIGWLPGK